MYWFLPQGASPIFSFRRLVCLTKRSKASTLRRKCLSMPSAYQHKLKWRSNEVLGPKQVGSMSQYIVQIITHSPPLFYQEGIFKGFQGVAKKCLLLSTQAGICSNLFLSQQKTAPKSLRTVAKFQCQIHCRHLGRGSVCWGEYITGLKGCGSIKNQAFYIDKMN